MNLATYGAIISSPSKRAPVTLDQRTWSGKDDLEYN